MFDAKSEEAMNLYVSFSRSEDHRGKGRGATGA